jgi:hypothetical protein
VSIQLYFFFSSPFFLFFSICSVTYPTPTHTRGILAGADPQGPNDASLSYQDLVNDNFIPFSSKTSSNLSSWMVCAIFFYSFAFFSLNAFVYFFQLR